MSSSDSKKISPVFRPHTAAKSTVLCEAVATQRVLARELKQAMRKQQKFSALRSHRVPAVAYGWFTASRRGSRPDVNFLQYPPTGISYTFRPVATAYDWKGESKPWQSQPIFSMKMSAAL